MISKLLSLNFVQEIIFLFLLLKLCANIFFEYINPLLSRALLDQEQERLKLVQEKRSARAAAEQELKQFRELKGVMNNAKKKLIVWFDHLKEKEENERLESNKRRECLLKSKLEKQRLQLNNYMLQKAMLALQEIIKAKAMLDLNHTSGSQRLSEFISRLT
jgi:hypothetical protein